MRTLRTVVCALTAVLLACTLVVAGFAACAAPPTTWLLAQATTSAAKSPYSEDALTELACATRSFTVDPRSANDNGDVLRQLACEVLQAAATAADPESPTAARWSTAARAVVTNALAHNMSAPDSMTDLAACGEQYALDANALSHLNDCNRLISAATPWLIAGALGALIGIVVLAVTHQRRLLGIALIAAPCVALITFATLGLWGAFDFNGLFAAFHGVLFPQGNWTFPSNSLLITMYPLDFWMGMAGVWLGTTAALAIISLTLGIMLIRKKES